MTRVAFLLLAFLSGPLRLTSEVPAAPVEGQQERDEIESHIAQLGTVPQTVPISPRCLARRGCARWLPEAFRCGSCVPVVSSWPSPSVVRPHRGADGTAPEAAGCPAVQGESRKGALQGINRYSP